jgi:hypothetical protein
MKIRPDYKGRKDEWTGTPDDRTTVRYYESIDEEGYFYELYVMIDGVKSAIIITNDGVSIDFRGGPNVGGTIHTNIVPRRLFEGEKELTWDKLEKIIRIIEVTDGEGRSYTAAEMEGQYQQYLRETGGEEVH